MTQHRFDSVGKTWCVPICIAAALMGGAVSQAMAANAVTDWNAFNTELLTLQPSGLYETRIYAIQHAAIHDALNTIRPRYRRYTRCDGVEGRSTRRHPPRLRRPRATCWPHFGRQTYGRILRWRRPRSSRLFRA